MKSPVLSFEFFPPRTDVQSHRFWRTLGCLEILKPAWVSVTYGALGSASQASLDTVNDLAKETAIPVAAHLTCSGQTEEQLEVTLDDFQRMGVSRIVALRGDQVDSADTATGTYTQAIELVALIAQRSTFDISVAAYPEIHPEASSLQSDINHLKNKLAAGAQRALTQFFFDPDVFLRWRDIAVKSGIDKPLVPGILPIHNIDKVVEFSRRCGATVPPAIIEMFANAHTELERRQRAIEQSVDLCQTLQSEGVSEFHFYTLNQSNLAFAVGQALQGRHLSSVAA